MTTGEEMKVSITVYLQVRLDEIDYLRIVHSSNYLKYMEHARTKLIEQQGVDLLKWVEKGVRFVVVNDTINYRYPATYGDELEITCQVEEVGSTSGTLGYNILERRTGKSIIQATTRLVTIDPEGKPTPIPEEVKEALTSPV